MKEKYEKLLLTFYTTADAMAMESLAKKQNVEGRLCPIPRDVSADCGIAWVSSLEAEESIKKMVKESELEVQGFYHIFL